MIVVIILPTYNEKGNIDKLIPVLQDEIFPHIKNHQMHILVVDDNSPDGTADEVKSLMKKWKNIELITGSKHGLGAAYVRGMDHAIKNMGADVMFEMDADGQHDPKKIPEFLKKIDEGYDMAIGTRYTNGGSIPPNWPPMRKAYSILGNLLVRIVLMRFWIHDWTGGYRALKKEVFLKEREELTNFKGYTFQVSFLHKAVRDGFKVAEVPFNFTDRTLGKSKIAPSEYIVDLLKYIFSVRFWELVRSPFLKYAITGFVGYLINSITLYLFQRKVGLNPSVASMIGAEFSIIWNFAINNIWAFKQYEITNPWKILLKFPQFNLVSFGSVIIIGAVEAIGHMILGEKIFGIDSSQVLLVIAIGFFVIPYSYTMYNIFIWKRWHISFLSKLQKMVG